MYNNNPRSLSDIDSGIAALSGTFMARLTFTPLQLPERCWRALEALLCGLATRCLAALAALCWRLHRPLARPWWQAACLLAQLGLGIAALADAPLPARAGGAYLDSLGACAAGRVWAARGAPRLFSIHTPASRLMCPRPR